MSSPVFDVVCFAALDWERRAVTDALVDVEPAGALQRWRGRLGDASCLVVQTGVGIRRAQAAAEGAPAARLYLACGCAGALAAELVAGDVVVAAAILPLGAAGRAPERRRAESTALAGALRAAGLRVHVGDVASSPTVLATVAHKRAAAARGAIAVEMESAGIAEVAARRGIPFSGLRVVLDGAAEAVPALDVLDEATGGIRLRLAATLLLRPRLWPTLARLARQQRTAATSLRVALAALARAGLPAPLAAADAR